MNPQILPNIFIKGMVLCLIYLLHSPVLTIKIIYFTPGMEPRAHLFIPGVEGIDTESEETDSIKVIGGGMLEFTPIRLWEPIVGIYS